MRATIAAAALACALPLHAQDEAARLMGELVSGKARIGAPFTLRDPGGASRSLDDFRGKLVLLYFGYTGCPDVCPTDLAHIAAAVRALGPRGERVQPIFVTLDPAHDTPRLLDEYVRAFHPRFLALRGSEEQTRRVARSFKIYFENDPDGRLDHAAFTFLLDARGRYVAFFPPGTPAARMVQMLREQPDLER